MIASRPACRSRVQESRIWLVMLAASAGVKTAVVGVERDRGRIAGAQGEAGSGFGGVAEPEDFFEAKRCRVRGRGR